MLRASGALGLWRALNPGPVILAYHNVIGAEQQPRGEVSLHLPANKFAEQMEWVASHFEVVSLREVAMAMTSGDTRRPLLALTFDDAYRGVFRHALPVLHRYNLPATVMVVETASESPRLYWWDVVAECRPQLDRDALRIRFGGQGTAILAHTGLGDIETGLPDEYWPADWALLQSVQSDTIELAAHTRTHPMLTSLLASDCAEELQRARTRLGAKLGREPSILAYPYGDWNSDVALAASRAGYELAVTTDRRWRGGARLPMSLPRQTISSGVTLSAFTAAASRLRLSH